METKIVNLLRTKGLKITPQRRGVINALIKAEVPVTVQEIYKSVKSEIPDISLDTVYRTLQLLVEKQAAVPLNLVNGSPVKYELQADGRPHHHLVCLGCGRSYCLHNCPLTAVPEAEEFNFTIHSHALEFYGYCSNCSRERNRNGNKA